jgi:Tol biopolymer transport system component
MAKYAASGHLIYVTSEGTLMAAPFDVKRLELAGDPIALTPGIGVRAFGSIDLDISQDGTLMYVAGDQTTDPSEIVWVDMNGETEVVDPGWVGDFRTLALSPDGRQLAVSMASEQSGEQQLWVKQLPSGPLTKITFDGTINDRPSWSPDGRFVTFRSLQATTSADLFRKRADGGAQAELVLDHERPLIEGTWSSDGAWLAYVRAGNRARIIEAIQPGRDSTPTPLSPGDEPGANGVRIAPTGKWFAYSSARSGQLEVYVHPFPNAGDAQYQVSTDGGYAPVWSHDGRRLFYISLRGGMMGVEVTTGETFTMGERRALFPLTEYREAPNAYDLSLDDSKFLMIRTRGGGEDPELIVVKNWFEELKNKVGN